MALHVHADPDAEDDDQDEDDRDEDKEVLGRKGGEGLRGWKGGGEGGVSLFRNLPAPEAQNDDVDSWIPVHERISYPEIMIGTMLRC